MKIYSESVYCVIELDQERFDLITNCVLSSSTENVKYLLAIESEIQYLCETLDVCEDEFPCCDYFKILNK